MTCTTPPELSEIQLLMQLNGEADPAVGAHLALCPHCRGRADDLERLHQRLKTSLRRADCPSAVELGEYHQRLLSTSRELVVAQHVRECPHCSRELAQLEEFLQETEGATPLTGLKVFVARIIGNNLSPAGALRGTQNGPIIMETEGVVITLDVQLKNDDRFTILGQIAADEQEAWTGAQVALHGQEGMALQAAVDDLGAFVFSGLAAGKVQIQIVSPNGTTIQCPDIDLNT